MKLIHSHKHAREKGWAILAVMSLAAAALILMASVMTWSNENSTVIGRNNEFFATSYAAEAATEKALSAMVADDQDFGEGYVFTQTAYYANLIPTASDNSYWTNYQFSGGTTANRLIVQQVSGSTTNVMGPPYSGLISVGATYDIIANAKNVDSQYGIESTVGQKITFGQIPIFQFAIFYQNTMEVDPGANMNITGLVHGNTNIYLMPNSGVTLDFFGDLSASGTIHLSENPLDPTSRSGGGTVTFDGTNHISNVNPLNLPVGTNTSGTSTNISQNVLSILQVPPSSENPNGAVGTNRLYNLTDLIVTISNGNVITVTSGVGINGQATVLSNSQWGTFISTNGAFYDGREAQTIDPVDINVGNLRNWSATNTVIRSLLSSDRGSSLADVSSVYVVDERTLSNAVVITNILSYTTNTATVTTTSYPAAGTYFPPVATNTLTTTSSNYPSAGAYQTPPPVETVSNQVTTSGWSSPPASGTYVGTISSNTVATNSTSSPAAGSYVGSVSYSSGHYHYNFITGYTFWEITGYIYAGITGYTYSGITGVTTNYSYATNYTQFALPGVVLTNGASLPSNGLSIATPDPVYIVGNWNVYSNGGTSTAGTSNTANTLPSAVYSDAITILSPSWNPANSTLGIGSRNATTDTVNAAFLTGNVPSDNSYYSGGVENFVRFLESWSGSGVTFYYNGSMVEMFPSQIANAPWPGTGTVYNPPIRDWTFDQQFTNPNNIPPLTPKIIYIQRSSWADLAPGTLASGF
jgi:hypothetical protein